ncbi:MAG: hypothetical protein QHJ82_00470 [Verrucomicrobiota bacterium]|nr:hypothetical protein [Verrucomicrobiota bacterium]
MRKLLMIGLIGALAGAAWTTHGQARTFLLQGVSVELEDATERVEVFYRSMRLNRALDAWNVEVTLSNRSSQALSGPLVLPVNEFSGTTGPQQADGTTDDGKSFYDLSGLMPAVGLGPGQLTTPRTLTLGRSAKGSPTLHTKVYTARRPATTALGVTRSLDAAGQPLPGVGVGRGRSRWVRRAAKRYTVGGDMFWVWLGQTCSEVQRHGPSARVAHREPSSRAAYGCAQPAADPPRNEYVRSYTFGGRDSQQQHRHGPG